MVYYVEYVFAENFIIDFILLYVTGKLVKRVIIYKRLAAASFVGALYVIITAYMGKDFMTYFIVKFSISVLMIMIAFDTKGFLLNIRVILCFYITSLIMVGIITALYYMTYDRLTVNAIVISLFTGYLALHFFFKEIKQRTEKSNFMRTIIINLSDKTKSIRAFIDTGNELKEPMTGKSVIVVNMESIKSLLNEEFYNNILKFYENKEDSLDKIFNENYNYNLRLIRYHTISSRGDMMICMKPDAIVVKGSDESFLAADALIGLYPKKISRNDDYDALLFNKILEMEMEQNNEFAKTC